MIIEPCQRRYHTITQTNDVHWVSYTCLGTTFINSKFLETNENEHFMFILDIVKL